jgi:hypothetical protein
VIKEEGDITVLGTAYRNRQGLKSFRLKGKRDWATSAYGA